MAKLKLCPVCSDKVPTNNRGKLKTHSRWDWPNRNVTPFVMPKSHEMREVRCEGSEV